MPPFRSVDEVQRFAKRLEYNSVEWRREAALRLSRAEDPRAFPHLVKALRDADDEVRLIAAGGIAKLRDPRAFSHLAGALKDSRAETRAVAAEGLGELRDPRALGPLMRIASTDEDPAVRTNAVNAIGGLGPHAAPAIFTLLRLLPDESLGRPASRALLAIGRSLPRNPAGGEHARVVAAVARSLREDEEPRAVMDAIESALGRKPSVTSAPPLPQKLLAETAVRVPEGGEPRAANVAVKAAAGRAPAAKAALPLLERTRAERTEPAAGPKAGGKSAPTLPAKIPREKGVQISADEERVLREAHESSMGGTLAARLVSEKVGKRSDSWVQDAWRKLGLKSPYRFSGGKKGERPLKFLAGEEAALRKAHGLGHSPWQAVGFVRHETGNQRNPAWVKRAWRWLGLVPNPPRRQWRGRAEITQEKIARLLEAHDRVMSVNNAARFAGVNPLTARKYLRKAGRGIYGAAEIVGVRAKKVAERWHSEPEANRDRQLVENIAKYFVIAPAVVERYLRGAGVKAQRSARLDATLTKEVLEELRPSLSKTILRVLGERGYFGGEKKTLSEVAKKFSVSRQAVHISETRALKEARRLQESRRKPE